MIAEVLQLRDVGELDAKIPGPLVPENVVKWAAYKALQNAWGEPVRIYIATEEITGAMPIDIANPTR